MKKLYVVDVSSMFFRAFYAIPPLTNKKGFPTNALYGFLSMTIKMLREIKPDYMAFCFDRKEPSFRYELYEDYKANRSEMPEQLVPQVPYVRRLTDLLGIPNICKLGLEADDVIGCLTKMGRAQGLEVVIVSGDKDFAQLVGPFVTMYDTMKDVKYDEQGVITKWGVTPEQMIDYLALVGDSSDNIPGVRGIGPKGAQKLLAEFKTLDGIYENLDKISSKSTRAKLEENKKMAYLSRDLVTIRCDEDLGVGIENLKLKPLQRDELKSVLEELEFNSFERMLFNNLGEASTSATQEKSSTAAVAKKTTPSKSNKGSKFLRPEQITEVVWALEELDKNIQPYTEIWGILTERGTFLGYGDKVIGIDGDLEKVGAILGRKHLLWKGFDLKEFWKSIDIVPAPNPVWDHMLAAYICRAGSIETFDEVYQRYAGKNLPDLPSPAAIYSCYLEVLAPLQQELSAVEGEPVLKEFELPLVPALFEMEEKGIYIDAEELKRQSKDLEQDIAELEKKIHKLAGETFNVSSPKQLAFVLFEKMGLPSGKKTKTGYSTDSKVLADLVEDHPIAAAVMDYRELAKLKSTYVDALPQLVRKSTGRIHTNFRQAITATGRLSSINPNLQNIPIRTERGRLIRKAFVASPGTVFLSADYSQIELRVLAHITSDPGLVRAFAEDLDIHAATASEIFGVKLSDVTADLRRKAKAVNFGIAYGQGAFGLAEVLKIGRNEATQIIEKYFQRFRGVRDYMSNMVEQAKDKGYVETIFGRRRYMEELKSKSAAVRKFGERAAINAPIQGTASDIVKKAMIALYDSIPVPMVLQVHDEILFECPAAEVEVYAQEIKLVMETTTKMKVPLKVNVAWGANWDSAHS